jgi:hypothetical protein
MRLRRISRRLDADLKGIVRTSVETSHMTQKLRRRFWIELSLVVANIVLLAVTIVWTEWIELLFQVDPDAGSGALEWTIAGVFLGLTIMFAVLARIEWRRASLQIA